VGAKAPSFRLDNYGANRNTTVEKIEEKIWYQIGYVLQIITVDRVLFKKISPGPVIRLFFVLGEKNSVPGKTSWSFSSTKWLFLYHGYSRIPIHSHVRLTSYGTL